MTTTNYVLLLPELSRLLRWWIQLWLWVKSRTTIAAHWMRTHSLHATTEKDVVSKQLQRRYSNLMGSRCNQGNEDSNGHTKYRGNGLSTRDTGFLVIPPGYTDSVCALVSSAVVGFEPMPIRSNLTSEMIFRLPRPPLPVYLECDAGPHWKISGNAIQIESQGRNAVYIDCLAQGEEEEKRRRESYQTCTFYYMLVP